MDMPEVIYVGNGSRRDYPDGSAWSAFSRYCQDDLLEPEGTVKYIRFDTVVTPEQAKQVLEYVEDIRDLLASRSNYHLANEITETIRRLLTTAAMER